MLGATAESLLYLAGLWFVYQGLSLLVKRDVLNHRCGNCRQALSHKHRYCGNCGQGRAN